MSPTRVHARRAPALAILAIAGFALLLSACERSTPRTPGEASAPESVAVPSASAPPAAFRRGTLRVAGEALTFTACGGTGESPLVDRTGGELTAAARSLGGGGPLYVEFRGTETQGTTPAEAVTFLRAAPVGEGGGCDRPAGAYVFQAFGNEPFWAAYVWADSLVFLQPDEPSHVAWPVSGVTATGTTGGRRTWMAAATAPGAPALTLEIEPGRCTDGMSGEVTAFRARATFAGRALEGCARAGTAADEAR
jgi:uncharacterized membrane protein